jgi:hypothetical protein
MDTNKVKLLKELLNDYDPSLLEYVDDDELNAVNSFDDLRSLLIDNKAFECHFPNYSNAMEYLVEYDNTLSNCVNIIRSFIQEGCNPEFIDSIFLAKFLAEINKVMAFTNFAKPKFKELFPKL